MQYFYGLISIPWRKLFNQNGDKSMRTFYVNFFLCAFKRLPDRSFCHLKVFELLIALHWTALNCIDLLHSIALKANCLETSYNIFYEIIGRNRYKTIIAYMWNNTQLMLIIRTMCNSNAWNNVMRQSRQHNKFN